MTSTDKLIAIIFSIVFISIPVTAFVAESRQSTKYLACIDLQKEMIKAGWQPKEACK